MVDTKTTGASAIAASRHRQLHAWSSAFGQIVRDVLPIDFDAIKRIAQVSFKIPVGWTETAEQAAHYAPSFLGAGPYGTMKAIVVVDKRSSAVAGYCLYQLRDDGELYIQEIAATPLPGATKRPFTGTLLVARLAAEARASPERDMLTANVSAYYRATYRPAFVVRDWVDPVPFYCRLGFTAHEHHAGGYLHDRQARNDADTWLSAIPRDAWAAIALRLGGGNGAAGRGWRTSDTRHAMEVGIGSL